MRHAGVATLMMAVRSEFWVARLRTIAARRVVRECLTCRRTDASTFSEQIVPLPRTRATQAPPFSVTGVDSAVCLFTCAVKRAVHLEMTESFSLEHFMMVLRGSYLSFQMNFPSASHMGGVWERMIRSARTVLNGLVQECREARLDDELLRTLLCEVEAIGNSRC